VLAAQAVRMPVARDDQLGVGGKGAGEHLIVVGIAHDPRAAPASARPLIPKRYKVQKNAWLHDTHCPEVKQ
jgi:hypothetical protein